MEKLTPKDKVDPIGEDHQLGPFFLLNITYTKWVHPYQQGIRMVVFK
jgi:hypothetical protein